MTETITVHGYETSVKVEAKAKTPEAATEVIETLFGVNLKGAGDTDGDGRQRRILSPCRAKEHSDQLDEITAILGEWWEQGEPESEARIALTRIAGVLDFRLGSLK